MKDVVIIGAGASSLSLLYNIRKSTNSILVLEKNSEVGGALRYENQKIFNHNGTLLSGRELIDDIVSSLKDSNIEIEVDSLSLNVGEEDSMFYVDYMSSNGIKRVYTKNIVNATGSIESTINQAFIKFNPNLQFFTPNMIFDFYNQFGTLPTLNTIIYGSSTDTYLKALNLIELGINIKAIITTSNILKDSIEYNNLKKQGVLFYENHKINRVIGDKRVEGIELIDLKDLNKEIIYSDSLILSFAHTPNINLLSSMDIKKSSVFSAYTDESFMTSIDNLFLIGDSLYIHESTASARLDSKEAKLIQKAFKKEKRNLVTIGLDSRIDFIFPRMINTYKALSNITFKFKLNENIEDFSLIFKINKGEIYRKNFSKISNIEEVTLDLREIDMKSIKDFSIEIG